MSMVTVHGPNTMYSKGNVTAGPVMATVNPSNGLIWTFRFTAPTTRALADFDWAFPADGTPATATDTRTPAAVTYAAAGSKTATLTVSGAGTGANPYPPAGTYPITVQAVAGVAPMMLMGEEGGGEEPPPEEPEDVYDPNAPDEDHEVEVGYDPAAHTVTEVIGFVEDHPEELDEVIAAEEAGKGRVTLLTHLESMREA